MRYLEMWHLISKVFGLDNPFLQNGHTVAAVEIIEEHFGHLLIPSAFSFGFITIE